MDYADICELANKLTNYLGLVRNEYFFDYIIGNILERQRCSYEDFVRQYGEYKGEEE